MFQHNQTRSARRLLPAILAVAMASTVHAADVTWTGAVDSTWDTTTANWSTGTWNNTSIDGAIFSGAAPGTINLPGPITVDSLSFTTPGYTLSGTGPLNFGLGTSTQTSGVVNVATGATVGITTDMNAPFAFQKIGAGTLTLSGKNVFTGAVPLVSNGKLTSNVLVGGSFGTIAGGTLSVANQDALPAASSVSIGTGYLDIGANDITIDQLIFTNQNPAAPWNTTLNANNGVIGTGKLTVKGEINVIGVTGNSNGNAIAVPLDLGNKRQVIRSGGLSALGLHTAIMLNGPVSNGSLTKTAGVTFSGSISTIDGIALNAPNTFTGPMVINSGSNFITNTNAATTVTSIGVAGAPGATNGLNISGANGSILGATSVNVLGGANLSVDNNVALGTSGNIQPSIPAAQNNNRLNDAATITMRDGAFNYRGFATAAATETFGNLSVTHGHNTLTVTPNGTGGTATLTASGNLTLGSRATLFVNTSGTGNVLGNQAKFIVGGASSVALPPAPTSSPTTPQAASRPSPPTPPTSQLPTPTSASRTPRPRSAPRKPSTPSSVWATRSPSTPARP
jgi:autotransporter-associated beta strand protein